MGWNTANDIVDPQIRLLVKRVENDEVEEAVAQELLVTLIKTCQDGDWDTEDETLELFTHVPWVVRAFKSCDVTLTDAGELPSRHQLSTVIRTTVDAVGDESGGDLDDTFWRAKLANKITDAISALLNLED